MGSNPTATAITCGNAGRPGPAATVDGVVAQRMAGWYQHVTSAIQRDIASRVDGLIWHVHHEDRPTAEAPNGSARAATRNGH